MSLISFTSSRISQTIHEPGQPHLSLKRAQTTFLVILGLCDEFDATCWFHLSLVFFNRFLDQFCDLLRLSQSQFSFYSLFFLIECQKRIVQNKCFFEFERFPCPFKNFIFSLLSPLSLNFQMQRHQSESGVLKPTSFHSMITLWKSRVFSSETHREISLE